VLGGLIILVYFADRFLPATTFGFPVSKSVSGFVEVMAQKVLPVFSLLCLGFSIFLIEKVYEREFATLYIIHGLKHYPWWQRRFYLHYALFLRALMDRTSPITCETITQLNSFAEIAGKPPLPESRLLQPAYIVPFIVLLNVLITEVLKQAEMLKGLVGVKTVIYCALTLLVLYHLLEMWHARTTSGRMTDSTIRRFLQWAERDIEEENFLRTQRLRAQAFGPHGPSH
jgi:hypothetical protein